MPALALPPTPRHLGFDLARAYAIWGMYVVNFNLVFGRFDDPSPVARFLHLFNGNSSSLFVILAGMGLALMTNRSSYTDEQRRTLKRTVNRRAWFLFVIGLALFTIWPADILHFYGAYMHLVLPLLFAAPRVLLWAAALTVAVSQLLFALIPFETGWDIATFTYTDFWTPLGFLRNTLYNGWNPVFPWFAYFLLGLWLGRLDWSRPAVTRAALLIGLFGVAFFWAFDAVVASSLSPSGLRDYLLADYLPPTLPFLLSTTSFALVALALATLVARRLDGSVLLSAFAATGQMTLTHYVQHLLLGISLVALVFGLDPTAMTFPNAQPMSATRVLIISVGYFGLSVLFSYVWFKRWGRGPLEALMRRWSDTPLRPEPRPGRA